MKSKDCQQAPGLHYQAETSVLRKPAGAMCGVICSVNELRALYATNEVKGTSAGVCAPAQQEADIRYENR